MGSLPFSSGSSRPRNGTRVSCMAGGFYTSYGKATREAQLLTSCRTTLCTQVPICKTRSCQNNTALGGVVRIGVVRAGEGGKGGGVDAGNLQRPVWSSLMLAVSAWGRGLGQGRTAGGPPQPVLSCSLSFPLTSLQQSLKIHISTPPFETLEGLSWWSSD